MSPRLALAVIAVLPLGCIASNVVAPEQRLVQDSAVERNYGPADRAAVEGYHESVDIRGEAAIALRRIWYVFRADGSYSGAALADVDGEPTFQTLSGTWSLVAGGLVLDAEAPVPCEMAEGHLRLAAAGGVVILRRGVLQ